MTEARAEWDAAYINDLPDSAFAVILPGGEKDDEGKTTPRSLRKLPHHNAAGDLDMPHLRNAMSREPQADMPEGMHARAQSHLEAHMESQTRSEGLAEEAEPEPEEKVEVPAEPVEPDPEAVTAIASGDIEVRDLAKREVDVRLLPWGHQIETIVGPEEFRRGAFAGIDPKTVYLYGAEHEMRMGMGQDGRPVATRVPVGRAIALSDLPDGPHATFKVARTAAGDENLALMADGIVSGVSVEFAPVPGGTAIETRGGRRVRVHNRARLTGATPTHRPAYGEQAAVLAVRSQPHTEIAPMADQEAPVAGADVSQETINRALAQLADQFGKSTDALMERLEQLENRSRQEIIIPSGPVEEPHTPARGEWAQMVIRLLTGDKVPEAQYRAMADVITSDNAGVVPPAYLTELIGVIDTSRPFLSTTRRLPTPDSGMQIVVPVINQRPLTGIQSPEKEEVASQKTLIGTTSFDAVSIAGAGDISIQVLKRSSRSFLDLWLELLAEAYAIDAEDVAITALANAMGGFGAATALNPEDLNLGAAFIASFDAIRRPPDTIWLSTQAVGEFIDAKASTTNQPLYPGLAASATAAGGVTGVVSGLRPVHVPTLDAHGAYAIVGPSSGFAWAEDGTYTLQVDVPSKAGRDVGLIGMLWAMPWYPAAFTAYNVAS
jgi:HK97 family phage major capsid protein